MVCIGLDLTDVNCAVNFMTGLSGISGAVVQRKGGNRFMVHWRCRLFMADKKIHNAVITSVFDKGFGLLFLQAVPMNTIMNVEFGLSFNERPHKIRFKGVVDYCLIRSDNTGADIDLLTTKIANEDQHTINNILQALAESKEFNLRL
ncbi:hypothetical protein Sde_0730 [Saccharophagus degradans 2-40]|uniref:Uncharacterized protein n=2 Tax=Saccharophagus degradans TaxID=86304 RepID=Q21MT7_SACD2|nr:hypothetical protein Sde_0730 [Saccharophagus degradans 2-40]